MITKFKCCEECKRILTPYSEYGEWRGRAVHPECVSEPENRVCQICHRFMSSLMKESLCFSGRHIYHASCWDSEHRKADELDYIPSKKTRSTHEVRSKRPSK